MKIGILSQWFPPESGSASVPGVLAQGLSERGHEVTVVTGFPNYPLGQLAAGYQMRRRLDEVVGAIRIRRVALYPSHDRSKLRRFANYGSFALSATMSGTSLLRDTDAIWVYNSPATVGLPSAVASVHGGPPHLMHIMDLWPDSILFSGLAAGRSYQVMATILNRWCDWTYERAGAIASISRGTLAELARRGVPDAKLHYVPIWTDEDQYHPQSPDPALREQLADDHGFIILYAGNLGDTQGLDGLLDVAQRTNDIDVRYVLAGSGTAEERLRTTATARKLKNITFLGRWPSNDMGRLLSASDLALVSLNTSEMAALTMPSKLPAILACGRPVLAWASGEVARTVRDGQCGFVADSGDTVQLERAIRDAYHSATADLRVMGTRAETLYRSEFSLASGVRSVERLLTELVGATRPGRVTGGLVQ